MSNEGHRGQPDEGSAEFGVLVGAQVPDLYRYASYLIRDRSRAEDLVGDTVVRALERRDQFRGNASLRTWLHQILYHLAVDRSRHESHEVAVEEVEDLWRDADYSVDAAEVVVRAELQDELRDALLRLPHGYQTVVVLHDVEGWSVSEIGDLLEIGLPAAKQRLRRGRMMLVSALAKRTERQMANRGVGLTCWEARLDVSDYIDDQLAPGRRLVLEDHMAHCMTCPPLYQALVGVTEPLGNLHDPNSVIPSELIQRIEKLLDHD